MFYSVKDEVYLSGAFFASLQRLPVCDDVPWAKPQPAGYRKPRVRNCQLGRSRQLQNTWRTGRGHSDAVVARGARRGLHHPRDRSDGSHCPRLQYCAARQSSQMLYALRVAHDRCTMLQICIGAPGRHARPLGVCWTIRGTLIGGSLGSATTSGRGSAP